MTERRFRVGIDVGGTFTKAVAVESGGGGVAGRASVPTTHSDPRGVAGGIVAALEALMSGSEIRPDQIDMISHSTTQAINALLERDTARVGVVAMGVGPERKNVTRRTRLSGSMDVLHEFLDTSRLLTEEEVGSALGRLRGGGAEVVVATEAFGVDDPSNEEFVMECARKKGLPATASHEISGAYGLEIRTLTAAVNASVLPRARQVADYVESALRGAGVAAPLMVMRGDGGISDMGAFRTKPISTVLSGPAASVAGALLHTRVSDGVFVEVGGTSTNICVIRGGRPQIKYVTVDEHPTCVRSMDVRVLGVAGGSLVSVKNGRIDSVGPRSAHIAGLTYSCYAGPDELSGGEAKMLDVAGGRYAVVESGSGAFAITPTCAANALDSLPAGDNSSARQESARSALGMLGSMLGVSYSEAALSVIQTASFPITKAVARAVKEFGLGGSARIVGGGGGASVLAPFVAKQLGLEYELAADAEVISSIGAASAMMQDESEIPMSSPDPGAVSAAVRGAHDSMIARGAVPQTVSVSTEFVPEKAMLRVCAVGSVDMDSSDSGRLGEAELLERASQMLGSPASVAASTEHHVAFSADRKGGLLGRARRPVVVLDRRGRLRMSMDDARAASGAPGQVASWVESQVRGRSVAPRVCLMGEARLEDLSGMSDPGAVVEAVRRSAEGLSAAVVGS